MGYDVHITKTKVWYRSKTAPISISQWKNLILGDSNLQMVSNLHSSTDLLLSYSNEGIAVWNPSVEQNLVYLNYNDGRISAKNPNKLTIKKLKEIAGELNAFVVGDEGEVY